MPDLIDQDNPDRDYAMMLEEYIRESQDVRGRYESEWDRCLDRYLGNHWDADPPKGLKQFTDNRIQSAVIAAAAIQTESRPSIDLQPVETNEPATVFLSDSGAVKASQMGVMLTPEQINGEAEIPQQLFLQLGQMTQAVPTPVAAAPTPEGTPAPQEGGATPAMAMQPQPVFTPDDFVMVTDDLVTEAVQIVIDTLLDRSLFDHKLIQNVLNKTIVGHQDMLVQWDFHKGIPQFINIHQRNCWIDPLATGIDDADYFIWAQVVSGDAAALLYPDQKDYINTFATEGQPSDAEKGILGQGQLGEPSQELFRRKMIVLWTLWKRNESFPMTPEQAALDGTIKQVKTPAFGPDGVTQIGETDGFADVDGNPITPDMPTWPTRPGIRQVVIIGDQEMFNDECPYEDIPVTRNINKPIPHRPYGQGDPVVLEDLNQIINRIFSHANMHYKYFAFPQQFIPKSVVNSLGENSEALFSHPGRTIPIDDDILQMTGGRVNFIQDPPTFGDAIVNMLQVAINEFKELSGYTDVLMGKPHSGADSGKAIQSLQNAARGSIGFKSLGTELAVRQIVTLVVGCIRDFMTDKQWQRSISKYPLPVLNAIRRRLKSLDFDIRVEIASGRGTSRQAQEQKAIQMFGMGAETLEGLLEKTGDPNAQNKAQQIMAERAAMAPQPQPGQSEPKKPTA